MNPLVQLGDVALLDGVVLERTIADGVEYVRLRAARALRADGVPVRAVDRDVVMRTCDRDGRLRHVDRPLALVDSCLFGEPARGDRLAWAMTTSTREGKAWTYVVAINTATERRVIADRLELASLGLVGSSEAYDWRHGNVESTETLHAELAPRDWSMWVCAPPGEPAETGDLTKYVTVPNDRD